MRSVDCDVDLLPVGVVQLAPDDDALVLADQVGVEVELSVVQLKTEVGVALADRYQAVSKGGSELHVELVTLNPRERKKRRRCYYN